MCAGGHHATVIAGYPWFLDWGRDSLIVARGLIAAGMAAAARDVILQFAAFSREGTVPNMIRGDDTGNRDTSDAPLWLFTACRDYMAAEGSAAILEADCGGRTLRRALIDLGRGLAASAPNQVAMDRESGLIFSPAHFTWMDTNHPAGTPRQGYPVEIQALWHAALALLAEIDTASGAAWRQRAQQVSGALKDLFFLSDAGYLADCLLADPGTPAARAVADDALRPNQLLHPDPGRRDRSGLRPADSVGLRGAAGAGRVAKPGGPGRGPAPGRRTPGDRCWATPLPRTGEPTTATRTRNESRPTTTAPPGPGFCPPIARPGPLFTALKPTIRPEAG